MAVQRSISTEVILWLLAALIVVCNAFVCLAFILNRRLRSATNAFVFSMSLSDLLVGCLLIPCYMKAPPAFFLPMVAFSLLCVIANVAACAFDRYVAILRPLRYNMLMTGRKVRIILLFVWLIPLIATALPFIWGRTRSPVLMRCHLGVLTFSVLIICIAACLAYCRIFLVARKHVAAINFLRQFSRMEKSNTNQKRFSFKSVMRDVRSAKLLAAVGLTSFVCWLPLIFINIFYDIFPVPSLQSPVLVEISVFTIFANSLIDPLIYALFQRNYRATIFSWIRCRLICHSSYGNDLIDPPSRPYTCHLSLTEKEQSIVEQSQWKDDRLQEANGESPL